VKLLSGLTLALLALPLGGCDWQTFKSSVAGSCAVFERPPYAVRGKTPYDQDVADNFVESGVAGCDWPRPAPRPAALDVTPGKVVVTTLPKKRGIIRKLRDRILPAKVPDWPPAAAPIDIPIVPAPAEAEPPPAVVEAPPQPPRSALDRLLHPDDRL
jgi:hypothetical protein